MSVDDAESYLGQGAGVQQGPESTSAVSSGLFVFVGANRTDAFAAQTAQRRQQNRRQHLCRIPSCSKRQRGRQIPKPVAAVKPGSDKVDDVNPIDVFAVEAAQRRQHARMRWVAELPERRGYGASPRLRTSWIVPRVVLVRASTYQGESDAQRVDPLPLSDAEPANRSPSYDLELEDPAPHHTVGTDSQPNVHVDVEGRSSAEEESAELLDIAGSDIGSSASIVLLDCPQSDDAATDLDVLSENGHSNASPEDLPLHTDSAIGSCDGLECAYPTNTPDDCYEYEGSIAGSDYPSDYEHKTVESDDYLPFKDSRVELGYYSEEEEAGAVAEADDGFVPEISVAEPADNTDQVDAAAETMDNSGSDDLDLTSLDIFMDTLHEELEGLEESIEMVKNSPAITEDEREYALATLEQQGFELSKQRMAAMVKSPDAFARAMGKRARMEAVADVTYQGNLAHRCFSHLRTIAQACLDKRQGEAN
ncbi:hypothetical protein H4R20_006486 [Coemansia guatemalensis]|uniref:Uncharacterized protein n=1 Tax=Coemansia guatemalensis TaxID=2761395 RepID=A0A9W8HNI7_9FUNG|nr:hypothetical protein H4R20_006486 [Coemansia guatemalensis]